jgi:D-amino-acid oxidase
VQVTVVGAGVIGLCAAVELQRAGHDVTVIAAATGDATVSAVAGAIWFPYRAGPPAQVARWARRTRDRLEAIAAAAPEAGVDVLTLLELEAEDPPWWLDAAPHAERTTVAGAPGWRLRAPRVEPALFLPWLTAQLARPIVCARVTELDAVAGDVVVHATGLGARTLAADRAVTGLAGQVVITAPGDADLTVSIADDRVEEAMFYAIPRRDTLVLGGCAVPCDGDDPPAEDAALTARILADAARLGVRHGPVLAVRRGLRPVRPEVRLERTGRVIHCYGHGGAGYTLALGCAEDVVSLCT